MKAKRVTVIDAAPAFKIDAPDVVFRARRRVAAYARVSTDSEEQLTSYETQVKYYTEYIQNHPDWQFVKVYTDEGISGLMTKHREGFQEMIRDALAGKVDLIITKSVSRFARNTVDTLTHVRKLKEKGVEVFFEKENIYTMDSKGELLITIMSSLAQEESRSISENVTWGKRKRFADGQVSMPYKHFLGYRKGADGKPEIVPEEAKVIRLIFKSFLYGMSYSQIAKRLTDQKIKSPAGKDVWQASTVMSILQNEKSKGDALLQKTYCADFLTKRMKKNEGEVRQYYVENNHEAIVSPEIFELAQIEASKRKRGRGEKSSVYFFSGNLICGCCGHQLTSKIWHSTSSYRRRVWQCGHKYSQTSRCTSTHLYEDEIKAAFVDWVNQLIRDDKELQTTLQKTLDVVLDSSTLEQHLAELTEKGKALYAELSTLLKLSGKEEGEGFRSQFETEHKKYLDIQSEIESLKDQIDDKKKRRFQCQQLLTELEQLKGPIREFDEQLWLALVDHVDVPADGSKNLHFVLRGLSA